jgi:hypothetical protein
VVVAAKVDVDTIHNREIFVIHRTIFVTQRQILSSSDVEIPIFAMFVTEYPRQFGTVVNEGRVYISYLEKTGFYSFHADNAEGRVPPPYADCVRGYIQYVKMLGYRYVHIWSSPPDKSANTDGNGQFYHVFKTEKVGCKVAAQEQLDNWYRSLLIEESWLFDRPLNASLLLGKSQSV